VISFGSIAVRTQSSDRFSWQFSIFSTLTDIRDFEELAYTVCRHKTVLCTGKISHVASTKVLFGNGHGCHYIVDVGIGYLSCPYRYLFQFPVYDANTGRGIKYEFVLKALKKYTNKFDFLC